MWQFSQVTVFQVHFFLCLWASFLFSLGIQAAYALKKTIKQKNTTVLKVGQTCLTNPGCIIIHSFGIRYWLDTRKTCSCYERHLLAGCRHSEHPHCQKPPLLPLMKSYSVLKHQLLYLIKNLQTPSFQIRSQLPCNVYPVMGSQLFWHMHTFLYFYDGSLPVDLCAANFATAKQSVLDQRNVLVAVKKRTVKHLKLEPNAKQIFSRVYPFFASIAVLLFLLQKATFLESAS